MSLLHVHAAAFTVLRIAHLGQVAALQVVATALELALGRARLWRVRQQHQRCRQRDDKHSHDLAPFSSNFSDDTASLTLYSAENMPSPRRFPAPWSISRSDPCYKRLYPGDQLMGITDDSQNRWY